MRPLAYIGDLGAGKTDQGEREVDKVHGRPRGSGAVPAAKNDQGDSERSGRDTG